MEFRRVPFRSGVSEGSKTQGIQVEYGPGPHCEDVADDTANPGGRALERFDGAGKVVTFHLERHGPAVANVDDPGIFLSSSNQYAITRRRKDRPSVVSGMSLSVRIEHGGR